ncbi:hypothetical protein Tco_0960420 [Tanacetum coccineum]
MSLLRYQQEIMQDLYTPKRGVVHGGLISADTCVLSPLLVESGRSSEVDPSVGLWNMMYLNMINTGIVNFWTIINLSRQNEQAVGRFVSNPRPLIPMRSTMPHTIEKALVDLHGQSSAQQELHRLKLKELSVSSLFLDTSKHNELTESSFSFRECELFLVALRTPCKSTRAFSIVPSNTSLVARINELESQMIEGKLVLLDDDGKPLKPSKSTFPSSSNVVSKKVDEDNNSEVEEVYDETATYMASTGFNVNKASKSGSSGGKKSLYEQWKENHDEDPYDDDDFLIILVRLMLK